MKKLFSAFLILVFLCSCQSEIKQDMDSTSDNLHSTNKVVPVTTIEPTKDEPKIQNQIEGLVLDTPITANSTKGSIFIASDNNFTNLWLLTTDAPHPFFDISVYKDTFDKVQEKNTKEGRGENKLYLIRAYNPFPLNLVSKIVFESNNLSILAGINDSSLHIINSDGTGEKLLADSKLYGNLKIIGVTEDKVIANSSNISNDPKKFGLTIVNIETGVIKLYMINGMAYALSEDSKYVLFHRIKDGILMNENWMLDIETGKEKLAE
jgi:hypothetical protein